MPIAPWLLPLVLVLSPAQAAWDKYVWKLPEDDPRSVPAFQTANNLTAPPARTWCYPSGLRVYAESTATDGLVTLSTVFGSGSAAETDQQHGVAHLLEHLWFRSLRPEGHQVWDELDARGTWRNAYTWRDFTVYLTGTSAAHVDDLLALEADRLLDPLHGVTEEVFAVEREVVRNELRRGYAFQGRTGLDALIERLLPPEHPYTHPTIGTHASLTGLQLRDAQDYVDAHYQPANASIHIRGDVHLHRLDRALPDLLPLELRAAPGSDDGAARRCAALPERTLSDPPPVHDPALAEVPYTGTERRVLLGWALPGGYSRSAAVSKGLLLLLSSSMEESSGEPVSCQLLEMEQTSLALCEAEVPGGQSGHKLLRGMERGARAMFKRYTWSWVNLWGSVRYAMAGWLLDDQDERFSVGSTANSDQLEFTHVTGREDYFATTYGWASTPAIGDARAHWERWFSLDNAARIILVPATEARTEPALDLPSPIAVAPMATEARTLTADELAQRMALPERSSIQSRTLDNGLTLVAAQGGTAGLAEVRLILPGGSRTEAHPGASYLAYVHQKSTDGGLFSKRFWQAPRFVSGQWTGGTSTSSAWLGVTGASRELDALLYMVRRRAEQVHLEPQGFGKTRRTLVEELSEAEELARVRAEQLRYDLLLGDHPGRADWSAAAVRGWGQTSRRDTEDWLLQALQPAGAILVVSSVRDPAVALAVAEKWFEDWAPTRTAEREPLVMQALPDATERSIHLLESSASNQRVVSLGCVLDRDHDRFDEAMRLAAAAADARIRHALRQERGESYSPGAYLSRVPGGGMLLEARAIAQPGAAGRALSDLLGSISAVADGAVDAGELSQRKLARADQVAQSYRSTGALVSLMHREATHPGTIDTVWTRPQRLAAVDPADVAGALSPCVGKEVITVVGPPGTEEELTAAGFRVTARH